MDRDEVRPPVSLLQLSRLTAATAAVRHRRSPLLEPPAVYHAATSDGCRSTGLTSAAPPARRGWRPLLVSAKSATP